MDNGRVPKGSRMNDEGIGFEGGDIKIQCLMNLITIIKKISLFKICIILSS